MLQNTRTVGRAHRGAAAVLAVSAMTLVGCSNAFEGGALGGGAGALAGLGIGSLFGMPGEGAAIGAISGALAGGVIGDQNQRNAQPYGQQRSRW